jgi:hypothetical protein
LEDVFDELFAGVDSGDWHPAARRFVQRFCAYHAEEDEDGGTALDTFLHALLTVMGYRLLTMKHHGQVWGLEDRSEVADILGQEDAA